MPPRKLMDKVDRCIIDTLRHDARQSNTKIAQQLGVSEASVRRRIGRLVSEGYIQLTAIIAPQKMGCDAVALIGLDVPLREMDSVAEKLAKLPPVQFVATTTGRYDLFIWATCKSIPDLNSFLQDELGKIAGINGSESFMNLDIKKGFLA